MKCSKCGRTITKAYYIDGKAYGQECYKQEMIIKYQELSDARLEEHIRESVAVMETLKTKKLDKIKNQSKLNFITSVLKQWQESSRVTKNQLTVIKEFFNTDDFINYKMAYAELLEESEKKSILKWLSCYLYDMCLYDTKKYSGLYQELKSL